jgi:hypothetical protein
MIFNPVSKKKQRLIKKTTKRYDKINKLIWISQMMELDIGLLSWLPLELLYMIFDMLPLHSIIQLSDTCHALSNICIESYVTRDHTFNFRYKSIYSPKFSVDDSSICSSKVMDYVYKWNITKIDLSNILDITLDKIEEIIFFCPNLCEITIWTIDDKLIYYIFDKCLHIKKIYIKCNICFINSQNTLSVSAQMFVIRRIGYGFTLCNPHKNLYDTTSTYRRIHVIPYCSESAHVEFAHVDSTSNPKKHFLS